MMDEGTPKRSESSPEQPSRLAIFPLQTVLFPGGVLPLRIFEARYMDMTTQCLRDDTVFGVNLIADGAEVGLPAQPHPVGVSARITTWDMAQPGLLQVVTVGERRFRILRTELGANRLLMADVQWLAEPPVVALPEGFSALVSLLRAIIDDVGDAHFPEPHHLDDAGWVGMRLAGVLPMSLTARQHLLELDDPIARLEIIRAWLEQEGLSERGG
ncbi:LON peptidase substrate-binding domain-containing protein [Rhodocyclaceae bacterium SMB388]